MKPDHAPKPIKQADLSWLAWTILLIIALYCALHLFSRHGTGNLPRYHFGCVDHTGKMVVKPLYDEIAAFSCDRCRVARSGNYGFIDLRGNLVIPAIYGIANSFQEDLAAVMKDGKWGYIDKNGRYVIAPQFANAGSFSEGRAAVNQNGHFGYIDKTGKWLVEPKFAAAGEFKDGLAVVSLKPYWEFSDEAGKAHRNEDIESIYPSPAGERLAPASVLSKTNVDAFGPALQWGLINSAGVFVVAPEYDLKPIFKRNRIICVKSSAAFVFNNDSKKLFQFEQITPLIGADLLFARKNNKWGLTDLDGKLIIAPKFDQIEQITADLFAANSGGKWGAIDERGNFVIPFINASREAILASKFEKRGNGWVAGSGKSGFELSVPSSPLQSFCQGTRFGATGKDGKIVIPAIFDQPINFGFNDSDEFAINEQDGRYVVLDRDGHVSNEVKIGAGRARRCSSTTGIIDASGRWVAEPRFDEIRTFQGGLAPFRLNGKWGFINQQGQVKLEPRFDDMMPFSQDGFAAVMLKQKWGFVHSVGATTIPPRFEKVGPFNQGRAIAYVDQMAGYIDEKGDWIVKPKYGIATDFSCGRALVAEPDKNEKYKLNMEFIDLDGKQRLGPFGMADTFADGLAPVNVSGDNWKMIDIDGKEIFTYKHYQNMFRYDEHILRFSQDRMPVLSRLR